MSDTHTESVDAIPQTLQELVHTEDRVALELQQTTGSILDLVAEFEKRHAALLSKKNTLEEQSCGLRDKISTVKTTVKRLTFPAHMSRLSELLKDFVDENTDIVSNNNNNNNGDATADNDVPSKLMRFVAKTTSSSSSSSLSLENQVSLGLPPMSREEALQFQQLFSEGGMLESRGLDNVQQQYFRIVGRVPPPPHLLTKADNPDEVLLDQAYVPFIVTESSSSSSNNDKQQQPQQQLRRRSPLTDLLVMRCPAVGGRVLVSRRSYQPGSLIFAESPFLSVPRSTTALLPTLPPLLQRVVREMLVLPQAQNAMKKQGWDPQLINCVLTYLSQQTFDAMARPEDNAALAAARQQQGLAPEKATNANWMWRAPAPLFRFVSGDFRGEDPQAKRRMRKLLFLGAPLQSMDAQHVHRLHKLAQFLFSALPPCYRDFEGDDTAARQACSEWARRGLQSAYDQVQLLELEQEKRAAAKGELKAQAAMAANAVTMAPYDDNPAHRHLPVSVLGRESCLSSDTAGANTAAATAAAQETEAATQLPPECRVSVSDIARIFAVFQTNCIGMRDERSFSSSTVASVEQAAGRALGTTTGKSPAQLPAPAPRAGLFAFMSMLEHSCCPNVAWCPASSANSTSSSSPSVTGNFVLELRALRPIAPGERLCVSYVPPVLPTAQRRQKLRNAFHFACGCEACIGADWTRCVVENASTTTSLPLSTTGDWVSGFPSPKVVVDLRATQKAAARVLCEAEEYKNDNHQKKQNDDDSSDDDDKENRRDGDDDDDNAGKLAKEPYKLVLSEVAHVEKLYCCKATATTATAASSSPFHLHPVHFAAYLRMMRLCTAWSYLIVACMSDWQRLYAEKVAPISVRVRTALCRAAAEYTRAVLPLKEAAPVIEALEKCVAPEQRHHVDPAAAAATAASASSSSSILPSEPRAVFVYSAMLPMLENIALTVTLEAVAQNALPTIEIDDELETGTNATTTASSSTSLNNKKKPVSQATDLWTELINLVENRLGWSKSPLAAKYRLYCANPT